MHAFFTVAKLLVINYYIQNSFQLSDSTEVALYVVLLLFIRRCYARMTAVTRCCRFERGHNVELDVDAVR